MSNQPRLSHAKQPAYFILREQGRGIAPTAQVIDVPFLHLRQVLYGHARPSHAVRDRLPGLVGVPLDQLFDPGSLRPPMHSAECDCNRCILKRARAGQS